MSIAAKDVMLLRERTGAGMMDCKKALTEANGDFDLAVDILRKKGQKVADKRADREANQGMAVLQISEDGTKAAALVLSCETDFVARNEEFFGTAKDFCAIAFANKINEAADLGALPYKGGITVQQRIDELTGKIGEKISVSRCVYMESAGQIVGYVHPGNQVVTLVEFSGKIAPEVGRDVAMQAAAMKPVAATRAQVSEAMLAKEFEIAKELLINEGKPAEIAEKAAQGKVRRFFEENVLAEQKFVKDNGITVAQYLKNQNAPEIVDFRRLAVGLA
jgi:elongation factor Ts